MSRIKNPNNPKTKVVKGQRKELIKRTKDKIHNINRASESAGERCIIYGNEIRKDQTFRALPKDKSCQEVRLYHLRTCGPGSEKWNAFKANGKKAPKKGFLKGQLSFKWKEKKR